MLRVLLLAATVACSPWSDLELPSSLLEYHIRGSDELTEQCRADPDCPVTAAKLSNGRCWGHEDNCAINQSYTAEVQLGKCRAKKGQASTDLHEKFFNEGDFGYLKARNKLHEICGSNEEDGSSLRCSEHLRYCEARNIYFDFGSFKVKNSARYRSDIIHAGEVGGRCEKLNSDVIKGNLGHMGYLQSWADELQHFTSDSRFSVDSAHCDVIFDRPTIIVKLDASVNMYHHFCDFINIYASQHINGSFDRDIDIVWWDTYSDGFVDAIFGSTWSAFSNRRPIELTSLAGRRVCFRNAMLPLLARQRSGLYYNMPLTKSCSGSGLVHAFSHHLLHRLGILQKGPSIDNIRVTILNRSTHHRRIVNIKELSDAVRTIHNVELNVVDYNSRVPFLSQLAITHNSDIMIGMHGAGLTHLMFLPDWAAIMEIYHCEDRGCYSDLARLRGVKYFTWPDDKLHLVVPEGEGKHPTLGTPHAKFTNYRFDADEFKKNVVKMVEYVRRHPKMTEERRKIRRLNNAKGEL